VLASRGEVYSTDCRTLFLPYEGNYEVARGVEDREWKVPSSLLDLWTCFQTSNSCTICIHRQKPGSRILIHEPRNSGDEMYGFLCLQFDTYWRKQATVSMNSVDLPHGRVTDMECSCKARSGGRQATWINWNCKMQRTELRTGGWEKGRFECIYSLAHLLPGWEEHNAVPPGVAWTHVTSTRWGVRSR
jgi:hypothetical protein